MIKRQYFKSEESAVNKGKYLISPIFENLPLKYTPGSFAILPARVLNLSFAQYLRMCRDMGKAEIVGKKSYYPIAYFDKGEHLNMFIRLLNNRMNDILFDDTIGEDIRKEKEQLQNKLRE